MNKPWDWKYLTSQSIITPEFIKENPKLGWNYTKFCENPNITFKIIKKNPNIHWNWDDFSSNSFTKEHELFMEQKMRQHNAAFKIQMYWRRANYDPNYQLCKRRLMREYKELGIGT